MSSMKPVDDGHKLFSPSSLYRIIACPASFLFVQNLPENERKGGESLASRRGTCAHAVGELVLTDHINKLEKKTTPHDYLGQDIEGVIVDQAIVDGISIYTDHLIEVIEDCDKFAVEAKLDLEFWKPVIDAVFEGDDLGGTMDFLGMQRRKLLRVTDYKNGAGTVEVPENTQLFTYALCALVEYDKKYKFKEVMVEIVQPNAEPPHPDGPIRSRVYETKYIYEWGENVLVPGIELALSDERYFNPGDKQCQWCPGKGRCTAAFEDTCDNAFLEFQDEGLMEDEDDLLGDGVLIHVPAKIHTPKVETLTEEQMTTIAEAADSIIAFVKAVKERRHLSAEQGDVPQGWKLVYKNANRKFKGGVETDAKKTLERLGVRPVDYNKPLEMKSPAQIETAMKGKGVALDKQKKFLHDYVETPSGGTKLVPESHNGAEIRPSIETDFADLLELESDDDLLEF